MATAIEYGLIAAGIAVVIITAVSVVGDELTPKQQGPANVAAVCAGWQPDVAARVSNDLGSHGPVQADFPLYFAHLDYIEVSPKGACKRTGGGPGYMRAADDYGMTEDHGSTRVLFAKGPEGDGSRFYIAGTINASIGVP